MTLIWRGAGILVPIITLAAAIIISKNVEDTYKGMGICGLIAGGILLAIGLITLPGKKTDPTTGEVTQKRKHDFFFLPIIVWGVLLLLGGFYLTVIK